MDFMDLYNFSLIYLAVIQMIIFYQEPMSSNMFQENPMHKLTE